jgi:uncharacterized protein YacL (UPF0231 family)
MVRVKGQIDAPLIDIANVRQEYWQRKEVRLPSVAKFMPKKKVWFGLREVEQEPKLILRRLSEEEWRSINERFWQVRDNLAKKLPTLRKLYDKAAKGQKLKATEQKVLNHSQTQSMPIYIAMLELMIEEPQMNFEDVRLLIDALDDYDRETLLSYVNSLTSEKAIVAHRINEERMEELNKMERQVAAGL